MTIDNSLYLSNAWRQFVNNLTDNLVAVSSSGLESSLIRVKQLSLSSKEKYCCGKDNLKWSTYVKIFDFIFRTLFIIMMIEGSSLRSNWGTLLRDISFISRPSYCAQVGDGIQRLVLWTWYMKRSNSNSQIFGILVWLCFHISCNLVSMRNILFLEKYLPCIEN